MKNCTVIDIFCGAGALTHGFVKEGFNVAAGVDADKSCKYAYETNNPGATFIEKKIEDVEAAELIELYPKEDVRILVGCAPCQPFSAYNKSKRNQDDKWKLLDNFSDLISKVEPDIVSMENVPNFDYLQKGKGLSGFCGSPGKRLYRHRMSQGLLFGLRCPTTSKAFGALRFQTRIR